MPVDEQTLEDLKRQQQSLKTTVANMGREAIDASLSPDVLRTKVDNAGKRRGCKLVA